MPLSTALTGMVIQEGAILNGGFCFVCSTEEMREFWVPKRRGSQELEQETGAVRAEAAEHKRERWSGLWDQRMFCHHCPEQSTVNIVWDENKEGDAGVSIGSDGIGDRGAFEAMSHCLGFAIQFLLGFSPF